MEKGAEKTIYLGAFYNEGAVFSQEDGPLPKSAGYSNAITITLPYGDWDHINRITWITIGGGSVREYGITRECGGKPRHYGMFLSKRDMADCFHRPGKGVAKVILP